VFDSHCHLDDLRFEGDLGGVLNRAHAAGVSGFVVPGVHPRAWDRLVALPNADAGILIALGVHPQSLIELDDEAFEASLTRLGGLLSSPRVVAVGECGLDARFEEAVPISRQLRAFDRQLDLARLHGLPVIIHCVRAHNELTRFLKANRTNLPRLVLHGYSGAAEQTKVYLDAGCSFSFGGAVTYPDARRSHEALRRLPLTRLLLETDAPDQAPYPHRRQRNEPAHLKLVAESVARILGSTPDEIGEMCDLNSRKFFGLETQVA
jgi:TatD DNase family protein